ncbi:ABC transporter substrate-binding protein [Hymenobacter negativus]|uniref:Amino acid ABC transporter substrate-binding protein n=1 Tax=Hymenobacter negativus TaxID=2795026 RepID=A0ABS3QCV3_9BACT|nr:ABC transporter substrate-binding protein [Hymenobacter negativus]MBO2009071.1 amino acid ABC transporter substrate-binding protein [Hymenobacter negativus]
MTLLFTRLSLQWLTAGLLLASSVFAQTPAAPAPTKAPALKAPATKAPAAPTATKTPAGSTAAPASTKAPAATTPTGTKPTPAKAPAAKPRPTAVPPAEASVRYRAGKNQLDQGNYAAALAQLELLAQPTSRFARAADAAYLAAVAAARLKQWPDAEQLLNLLRTEYPTYPNMPDALFLQGQASFEQEDFDTALKTLSLLPPDKLVAERDAMKAAYLPRIKDRNTWLRNLRRYPDDAALARAYADHLIVGGAYTDADRPQLDELIAKFSLDRARYTPRPRPVSVRKTSYNIGVLLPFELSDPSWQTVRKNQFVTDLYAGLRLAQDSLQRAGHPVQLFAYDTGADTLTLKQTLALPELASMDMLIGPIYKSGARLLARYAREHQIICVNPLSQDGDLVLDNPWHYLFAPSAATQGRLAAQFAANSFGLGKPAILLAEDGFDDTSFAAAYKSTYEELGGKISIQRRFNAEVDAEVTAAFAGLDLAGASHIMVASDNRRTGPVALAALRTPPAGVPRPLMLCPSAWLENSRIDLAQLSGNVYFIQSKYFDETAPGFRRFRQLYLQSQHIPPSVYADQGFELLLYFGNALFQYGPAFQQGLAAAPQQPGAIFEGQSYSGGAHDNQVVPIVKLNNLEIQVLR